jgi:hypothetical protein
MLSWRSVVEAPQRRVREAMRDRGCSVWPTERGIGCVQARPPLDGPIGDDCRRWALLYSAQTGRTNSVLEGTCTEVDHGCTVVVADGGALAITELSSQGRSPTEARTP